MSLTDPRILPPDPADEDYLDWLNGTHPPQIREGLINRIADNLGLPVELLSEMDTINHWSWGAPIQ